MEWRVVSLRSRSQTAWEIDGASAKGTSTPRPVRQQFLGMPVGCGNDCLARAETVGKRAARDLRLVQIRRDINVGRAEKLQQLVLVHEAVEKDHVLFDAILLGKALEAEPVRLAVVPDEIGMRRAEHDVHDLGKIAARPLAAR